MLEKITMWFYGAPMLTLVISVGLILTFKSRFFQLRKIVSIIKSPFGGKRDGAEGGLSPFQAMSMAIGGSVGVANISGVATAIVTGGPGALFWMLAAALLGMVIKMAEVSLACLYQRRDKNGKLWGGPTYYIEAFLGREHRFKQWRIPAVLFGAGIFVSFFINIQNYSVAEAIGTTFNVPYMIPSVILGIVTYVLVSGGLSFLGKVSEYLVPFMCLFYMACVGAVLFICRENILPGIKLIISNAFSLKPAIGGAAGTGMILAMKTGFSRALYSNEAGWGTSPMVHASAECEHPVKQGMLGAFEVFADTVLVCSATGLLVICTGAFNSGLMGAELTLSALESYLGTGARVIVAFSVFLFGLSSAVGWYAYYLTLMHHGLGEKRRRKLLPLFNLLMPLMGVLLTLISVRFNITPDKIWVIADFSAVFPTMVNLVMLWLMRNKFKELVKDWENKDPRPRVGEI